jgi:hypothetical protein
MKKFLAGCKSKKTAMKLAPWACYWLRVEGGYLAFEFSNDAYTWLQQK